LEHGAGTWRQARQRLQPRGTQCTLTVAGARGRFREVGMIKLLGISGSLRRGSYNTALLRAAAQLMPAESALEIASIRGIPLFDGDVEAQGIPPSVTQLKEAIVAADAVLLATPEYNHALPGVFKNAIDWLSRPPADVRRVFNGRPFALIGASSSYFGTMLSQTAWLPVLRALGTEPWYGGRITVARAAAVFDEAGALKDATVEEQLRKFLEGYVAFVRRAPR
jgi:chromate reductase